MRTRSEPHKVVGAILKTRGIPYRQVADDTRLNYKRLLREAKTGESKMTLDTAAVLADYLNINIAVLTSENEEQAA